MLRKLISIIMISISIIILFYNYMDIDDKQDRIDNILNTRIKRKYYGYIFFPKLNHKNLISEEKDSLDKNLVQMISKEETFNNDKGNIILAGHNNKYVFSNIYRLSINDEIIISDFNNTYSYIIYETKYINIKDKSILDNIYDKKILTLITCTNNNQIRFIIRGKYNHIISHN